MWKLLERLEVLNERNIFNWDWFESVKKCGRRSMLKISLNCEIYDTKVWALGNVERSSQDVLNELNTLKLVFF